MSSPESPVGVALYGSNGHQIHNRLIAHPGARLVGVAGIAPETLPPALRDQADIAYYATLGELLADARVDLVSLCSPRRSEQARHACDCLRAGKHVYAEKPCALTEGDLDRIIATAHDTGRCFHEMADTAFEQPYVAMTEVVASGVLGQVVQVFAQKSYPYHDRRPQDEDTDGGLTAQVGVHALRMIAHVAGQRITEIKAFETRSGNPVSGGDLRMATSLMMRLEGGGVASVVLNYLNQSGTGQWGNEHLRIFGTDGFVEATDGGRKTRLVIGDTDHGPLDTSAPVVPYFDRYVALLQTGTPMPLSMEDELHPTRMTIRARANAL
ncbi:MAG: Gfo/Idh/MocA family oxidoreductase [Fibrella sp.]|nr:Gfo/Idh/MocA family oxidoreductase [Armatimonadota bacterium]